MRALLRIRPARWYLAAQGLSMLGDRALWLVAAVWVKDLTGSSGAAGAVFLAVVAPQLLSPLAGVLVDRLPRRALLIATNVLAAAGLLPLLLVQGAADVWSSIP